MNDWSPAKASAIAVGDQTLIDDRWQTITAVGYSDENIVIYVGAEQITYPADADVMVRTAEDRDAIRKRVQAREQAEHQCTIAELDAAEPWYLKLLNRFAS